MPADTFTAEIHFHQHDEVSVFYENDVSDETEQMRGEIRLFVNFAIRQMSNLGVNQITDTLANQLATVDEVIDSLASGYEAGGVRLVRYAGTPGRKRFFLRDDGFSFDMKAKGFGLLWRGMGYYGPVAVITLLRFFAQRRSDSYDYLRSL